MPPRALIKAQPTVYLDQSTLSGAFHAQTQNPQYKAYEPLVDWIGTVARNANLCLNAAHILEIAAWEEASAGAMSAWLEMLPVVWTRWFQEVQQDEEEGLVRVAAGEEALDAVSPFSASFLVAVGENWSPELLAIALRNPTIPAAVQELSQRDQSRERSFVPEWLRVLRNDRDTAAKDGVSGDKLEAFLDGRFRDQLRQKGEQAHQRIWNEPATAPILDRFVELYEQSSNLLPTTRVTHQFKRGFESATSEKDPDSKRTIKGLRSSFHDMLHLAVGAAYCTVFTCDAFTAECLGDVRDQMGLPPPFFVRRESSAEEFVEALMETCSA
jgi:hypothetical protein